jgi:NADP-dependent 3-hydroxy acid dehydrogenase YdfG
MDRLACVARHLLTTQPRPSSATTAAAAPTATAAGTAVGGGPRKTIVVTGCTSGLGLALVENYARMGHRVVGCGRRADRIKELAARLGGDHVLGVCAVDDEQSVRAWAAEVLGSVGGIDVLINNAGVSDGGGQDLWTVPRETWERVLGTNVHGILNVMRALVPSMVARGRGLIVNISSGTGHSTFDSSGNGVYSTSKWAVESISKCMAMSLPAGLICVPWAPGIVKTEMNTNDKVPTATEWGVTAAPLILNLGDSPTAEDNNGTSLIMPGFYPADYIANWSIPPNHPLPPTARRKLTPCEA